MDDVKQAVHDMSRWISVRLRDGAAKPAEIADMATALAMLVKASAEPKSELPFTD